MSSVADHEAAVIVPVEDLTATRSAGAHQVVEQARASRPRRDLYGGQSLQERAADRRARISRAALELFAGRSYDDVTVAEVCARAKVLKRRYFYEHFTDREDLLLVVHREQNDWLLAGVSAAAPKEPENLDAPLRPMMTALVTMLLEHPDSARVIYIKAPRMELRRRGVLRNDAEVMGRLLRRSVPRPCDRVRHERLMLTFVAGVSEVMFDWLERGMTDDPDVLIEHLTGIATALLSGTC
ncbi:TetR/AcrR family transcriptional regulator [Streptomyces sp. NPDC006527]|uniref:TetR/AcrR family transcriptional regulator n=1 Tax=Streptomyces sp. NPDC006527 TaxID=3364749 RepID=UPI0036AA3D85